MYRLKTKVVNAFTTVKSTNGGMPAVDSVVPAGAISAPATDTALVPVKPRRHYQRRGRRFRHGQRAAALRGVTAARAYLRGDFSSLVEAADGHGSCAQYVAAAIVVLKAEDSSFLAAVLSGARDQPGDHEAAGTKRLASNRRCVAGRAPDCIPTDPHNHEFRWQHQQKACREPVSAK